MPVPIASKRWVPWNADDDAWIVGARVIGRAELQLAGGGVVHALLLSHDEQPHVTRAVYLDRALGTFVTAEILS